MKKSIFLFIAISILSVSLFAGNSKADIFNYNDSNEFGAWIGTAPPGYGQFEFKLKGTTIGKSEIDPLEFSINVASLSIDGIIGSNNKGWMFAGHLGRFNAMQNEDGVYSRSTWLGVGSTDPKRVPEPSTMLLLGTGVIGLAAVGRKRRK